VQRLHSQDPQSRRATIGIALLLALVWSTQFLAQPFVWRHWEVDEVLLAWLGIIGERVLMALTIVSAALLVLAAFDRRPTLHRALRAGLYTLAIIAAATFAEGLLWLFDASGAARTWFDLGEHVVRWSTAALAVTGLRLAWLRAVNADVAADRARRGELDAQAQLAALRLQGLQAQIEPHFLFNTLATVKRLGATAPAACTRLLDHLVNFIALSRAAQPGACGWRVANELALAQAYLGVVALRMDGRLHVDFDIDPRVVEHEAPPLALATLVENAVKHGIAPSTGASEIRVGARLAAGRIRLEVADTGVGLTASGGSGIGLANTRARLRSLYGDAARLVLAANQPTGVVAALEWPARPSCGEERR
jgi:signal transduction histidine kinase